MAGESYGGRYLPIFASAVHDNNAKLVANKKEPVNLKSVMIGNGITSFCESRPPAGMLTAKMLRPSLTLTT